MALDVTLTELFGPGLVAQSAELQCRARPADQVDAGPDEIEQCELDIRLEDARALEGEVPPGTDIPLSTPEGDVNLHLGTEAEVAEQTGQADTPSYQVYVDPEGTVILISINGLVYFDETDLRCKAVHQLTRIDVTQGTIESAAVDEGGNVVASTPGVDEVGETELDVSFAGGFAGQSIWGPAFALLGKQLLR
jgi:hypothetical protein